MDCNQKSVLQWDWENFPPFGGNEMAIAKPALHEWKVQGVGESGNGSLHSPVGDVSSCSDFGGNGSSKSSICASIDSSSMAGSRTELNFDAAQVLYKELNKNDELAKAEDTGTSPFLMAAVGRGEPAMGLKLGKRTYFEDVCGGNNVKDTPHPDSLMPSTVAVKKMRVSQQRVQKSFCQVEGCKVDLAMAKDYHRKHRVCKSHSKSAKVIVAGQERRFCQQCSRFHDLSEFDQKKRSCRRRLSDHNARRRKPLPETISFSSPGLSAFFHGDRQHINLVFSQLPNGQLSNNEGYLWEDSLHSMETTGPWMKPVKDGAINELHFPSPELLNNNMIIYQDFDSFLPLKSTTAEALNQGIEDSVVASNSNGAPDLRRALSLLSTDSWGSTNLHSTSHLQYGITNLNTIADAASPLRNSASGYWQHEMSTGHPPWVMGFGHLANGNQSSELQLPKISCGTAFNPA